MKKLVLLLLFSNVAIFAGAQKKYINNAEDYLKSGDLDKAKTFIDQAVTNDKTSTDPEAWFTRGEVYRQIGESDKFKNLSPNPDSVALASFQQCQRIKPGYQELMISSAKFNKLYGDFWNGAINDFKTKDYTGAYKDFNNARETSDLLHKIDSLFGSSMDTLAILNMSKAAYNAATVDPTEPSYMDSTIMNLQLMAQIKYKDLFIYQVLLSYYLKQKNTDKFMATAEEAKLLYPENTDFGQQEMEYYRETGKMDLYLKQLQEGVTKDPSNYALVFNLGVTYDDMANPKDSDGNSLPKPGDYEDLFNKATDCYTKAIALKPNDYAGSFNLGLLDYNRAAQYGKQLGDLGNSKSEQLRADSLTKAQGKYLDIAYPYLEKAYEILDAKPKLTDNELNIYQEALTGLKEIYARKNQTDKYNEVDQKLKNADSKLGN